MSHLLALPESVSALDGPATAIRDTVRRVVPGPVRAALRGDIVPGHPLHPALVAIPIGAWTCVPLFDFVFHRPDASRLLVATGLVGAVPSALTGWADFAECDTVQRRVGLVHAAVNGTAVALMAGSLAGRRRGHVRAAVAASTTATALVGVAGALGGHLAYVLGAGTRRKPAIPDPGAGPAFDPALA